MAAPDLQLSDKLKAEAGAILRWMIEGAVRYHKERLEPSPAVKAATAEYFKENDTIQQWLDDCAQCGVEYREKADRIYDLYKTWAEEQGFRFPLTRPKFTSKLKTKGIFCKPASYPGEGNSVRCYIGMRVKPDDGTERF